MEQFAVVAELAYAHDSGSCPRTWVGVQVPSTASYRMQAIVRCALYAEMLELADRHD